MSGYSFIPSKCRINVRNDIDTAINSTLLKPIPMFFFYFLVHKFKNTHMVSVKTSEKAEIIVSCNVIVSFVVTYRKFQQS